jgi:hypothetical protein
MRAGPARHFARLMMTGLSVVALAACHSAADRNGSVVVANEQAATPAPDLPTNIGTADHIEPLNAAVAPTPLATPAGKMQPRKAFTDPPLPAELNDDGGLKPLPPRPHPGG